MNPEKLFDYLEGTLPEPERAQLEKQLATDGQLQRELAIAREMHRRSRGSREVLGESDEPEIPSPAKPLGRRVAIAFFLLVLLNVFVGIAFIIGKKKDKSVDWPTVEAATRKQLEASLQKAAETSLPAPIIAEEIQLPAPAAERDAIADHVITLARQAGGSAVKAPPDEKGINVVVDLPGERADEFRRSITPLAPAEYSPTITDKPVSPGQHTILQVRVGDRSPAP
jgi:anti-sigma factor RsiW